MPNLEEKLDAAVETHKQEYIALLAELVRYPSTLGDEKPAQERLLAHVLSMGLEGELWDLDPAALKEDPRFVPVDRTYEGRPNLTAVLLPQGQGGRSLLFNGHIDVVSPEPTERWTRDPWGGEVRDDRLYGRGAYDMKGGLVQALLAIRAVQATGVHLRGPVVFESVIEEECTGNGMLAARLRDEPVNGVVLTECVGQIATLANTGTMWVGVTLEGKPAYVGRAGEYVNAIEKAAYLIPRLSSIADEINATFSHPAYDGFERPFTFSVGTIEGGDWPSNVPLLCRFVCRLSYPPGVAVGAIKELVERQIRAAVADDPCLASHPPQVDYPGFHAEGWATDATAPLVTALGVAHTKMTGNELETGVLFGTADARYLNQGEQAIYYGPAGGGQHGPDEYVDLDTLVSGAKVLARLIAEWCG